MRVESITNRKLRDAFVRMPHRVYADDPSWVAPLNSDAKALMNPKKNPFHKHAAVEHFVTMDGNEPAGRIAACIYPKQDAEAWTGEGAFGFFECVDDQAVADGLFRAAEAWLAARGCRSVVGPYSYCATQDSGLLTGGFDTPPSLFQTHNPPYYEKLIRNAGYRTKYRAVAYTFTVEDFARSAAAKGAADPATALTDGLAQQRTRAFIASRNLSIRRLDMRRYAEDVEAIRRLLNTAFSQNEGVLPVTQDVFAHQAAQLKPFIDPNLVAFIERNGEPVAFTFLAPDVFRILKPLNGRLSLSALLSFKSRAKALDSAVILLVGALPDRSLVGVSWALVGELVAALAHGGYKSVTTTWVHESNTVIHRFAKTFGGKPTKTYEIFSLDLASL